MASNSGFRIFSFACDRNCLYCTNDMSNLINIVITIMAIPYGKKSLYDANNGMNRYLFIHPKIPQPCGTISSRFLSYLFNILKSLGPSYQSICLLDPPPDYSKGSFATKAFV